MNRIRKAAALLTAAAATLIGAVALGGQPASAAPAACLTPAALHSAAVHGNTAVAHLDVNWSAGTADYVTAAPLCSTMFGTGAQNVYWVGAKPIRKVLWPQSLAASSPAQPLSRAAGHHPFRFPPIRNECGQTDVSVTDHPIPWPKVQPKPGTPQPPSRWFVPGRPGERVGTNVGCYPSPAVRAAAVCPRDCAGRPTLNLTLTNRAPYATLRVVPVVAGRNLPHIDVPPGRTVTRVLPIRDGDRWHLSGQFGYGRWSPIRRLTVDAVVVCPPWPTITITAVCVCGPTLTGQVADANRSGRYIHDVTVTAGSSRWKFRTRPGQTVAVKPAWRRGVPLVVTVQNLVPGHLVGPPVVAARVLIT